MKRLVVLAAVLMLFGCASTSEMKKMSGGATDFPGMVKEAKASIKKAKSAGGEWRDSKKYLKKAAKAAKAGDVAKALKLATKAKEQGQMGYKQAVSQKNAGPWLF